MKEFFVDLLGNECHKTNENNSFEIDNRGLFGVDTDESSFEATEFDIDKYQIAFWIFLSLTIVNSAIAIIGNGLVIYAGMRYRNDGRLRYLDGVVKSLALTDLMYASFGVFANYINYYLHKHVGK